MSECSDVPLPSGNSAPSESVPPDQATGGLGAAARSAYPWQQSQGSCWHAPQPVCLDAHARKKTELDPQSSQVMAF